MTVGEKIQKLRKDRGISQDHLATELNVTRQAISKWETGDSIPDIDNLVKLSTMFNVSLDYLLKNQEQTEHNTAESVTVEVLDDIDDLDSHHGYGFYSYDFKFDGSVYTIATVTYLVLGFWLSLWHPGWLVFLLAGVIDDIIKSVRKRRYRLPFGKVALLVFLSVGFIFGAWHPWWVIFVIAWLLSDMITPKKRKKHSKHGF